jgi:uncharacterized protein YggE
MVKKVVFSIVMLLTAAAFSGSFLIAEENQIVVSATGSVTVKPDMAEFRIQLKSLAGNADKAAAQTAERYRAVQKALRSAGIPSEDAPSAGFTVSPEWEWSQSSGRNVLKGYAARHIIDVKIRDLKLAGKAIDAVVQAGADEVQNIRFFSSNFDVLRRNALAIAVENARKDADIMAKAAGGRVGGLIELNVQQPATRGGLVMEMMEAKAAPAPAPTEFSPSDQEIQVGILSRWRFIGVSGK